ncbi:MAG: CPBP family intramembrane glutamic endopeptidase [Microscillaceae bacterium]|nr:CPBP family intramembrane glutamic endopeptidase [Microscillaceae bacterium]
MNYPIKRHSFSKGISNSLIIIGFFLIGVAVAFLLVPLPLLFIFNISFEAKALTEFLQIDTLMESNYGRLVLLYIQGFTALGGFVLSSYLYLRFFSREKLSDLSPVPVKGLLVWVLVVVITLCVMPFTSWLIEWNSKLHFPAFLSELEQWALKKEQELQVLTIYLTSFKDLGEFLVGLLVIALIPAIGEELLFRGLLQRNFQGFLNAHIAVWLSAILFSAFHLQFLGFIPRMMLGALFGYLYFWSGNLWTSVLAHFVNNAFTLSMIYLYHKSLVKFNIMEAGAMSSVWVLVSLLVTVISLYNFRKIQIKDDIQSSSQKR